MISVRDFIKLLIGTSLIFFVLYNRFLIERKPQLFSEIENKLLMLLISFFAAVIFGFISLYLIKKLFDPDVKTSPGLFDNFILEKYKSLIVNYIINTPVFVYEKLTKDLDLSKFLELPASYATAYFRYPRFIVILFYFIPQIVVASSFFLEVFYFHQRIYFFKLLNLLILFLIVKLIFFVFKNYSARRLENFSLFLDVNYEKEGVYLNLKLPDLLPQNIPLSKILAQYHSMCNYWYIYTEIYSFTSDVDAFYNKYKLYVQLFTSFLFFIGWIYCFYFFASNYVYVILIK